MKAFITSTRFMTGAFIAFVCTTLVFTFVLTMCYTPNNLLEHSGFYKDGKHFRVIESSQLKGCKRVKI